MRAPDSRNWNGLELRSNLHCLRRFVSPQLLDLESGKEERKISYNPLLSSISQGSCWEFFHEGIFEEERLFILNPSVATPSLRSIWRRRRGRGRCARCHSCSADHRNAPTSFCEGSLISEFDKMVFQYSLGPTVTSLFCASPKSTPFPPFKSWQKLRAMQSCVQTMFFSDGNPVARGNFPVFIPVWSEAFQACQSRGNNFSVMFEKNPAHWLWRWKNTVISWDVYSFSCLALWISNFSLDSRWWIFYQDGDSFVQNWPKLRIESDRFPYPWYCRNHLNE